MKNEILQHLFTFKDNEYHEINDFLKQNYGNDIRLFEMRGALTFLIDTHLIEVADSAHYRLSLATPNIDPNKNIKANLDNWLIRAKILEAGRDKIEEENFKKMQATKAWYETENAKIQYENYPTIKRQAKYALIIAAASLLASIV
ncbi:MAG TPA: hypothetical protein VIL78_18210 [Hanamia sp.]